MKIKRKIEEKFKEEKILYDFLSRDTVSLAKELLGKLIKVKYGESILSGYIVETEAYLGKEDMACHGYNGNRTQKWRHFIRKKEQFIFIPCTHIKC